MHKEYADFLIIKRKPNIRLIQLSTKIKKVHSVVIAKL